MLYFLAYSGLITGIAALIFGAFVYSRNKNNAINRSYGILSLSIAVWGIAYYFWPLAETKKQALISFRMLHIGAILIAPSFLCFILALLGLHKKYKKIIFYSYGVAAVFLILDFTRLFIKDMTPQYIFHYWAVPGITYHFYLVFWFGFTSFAWVQLLREYKKSNGFRKNQLKYVLIASFLGFFGGATNYLPWYRIYIPPAGTILAAVHIVLLAYAIVKYRLMDIGVAITRTGIFIAVYTLVLGLPFQLSTQGQYLMIKLLGVNWWVGPLVLMGGLGIIGPFVYMRLKKSAEAIIFREQLRYQKALRQAAEEMTRVLDLKKLLNFIVHTLTKTVRISHAAYYSFDANSGSYLLSSRRNLETGQLESISALNPLVVWLQDRKKSLVYEEINRKAEEESLLGPVLKSLENEMLDLNAKVAVPAFLESRLTGIIILGDKRSGKIYSSEDLNTFQVLASQAALAIKNASLYGDIEGQVHERTRELAEVQKQLIQAEKLASVGVLAGGVAHEINNPLTAILTNTQMLLGDDNNPLDPDTKESLELIQEATKRCRTIVQKLMAYARKPLESAQMSKVGTLSAVNNVTAFLDYQLAQENIRIIIHANPEEEDYFVSGNQNELEQVITNIVLNARDAIKRIKKSGDIGITLHKNSSRINIEIKDDGIGISKEIISKIFDPFFTTKDVGKGLGLGLSICQAIIEKHKGLIMVKSEPGKGSAFTIQLPKFK
ncbi:MAG: ATP-binding protein [Candidatus Omnitrophota bacterium]